uniref:Putative ovule protein n=1 Tax=Solanum chacoense TaxID=4108 RepID=A0A0V0H468_SOLCH
MIIPEKIEKQEEIQKIEIPGFYARKRVIGITTILNELSTNYLSENSVWSYYAREQTMIYSNSRETREADMEEIRQWILSLLKPEQQPTTRAIRRRFISPEIMANYCRTIGHKYPDHQCSKCYGEDNVIPVVNLE